MIWVSAVYTKNGNFKWTPGFTKEEAYIRAASQAAEGHPPFNITQGDFTEIIWGYLILSIEWAIHRRPDFSELALQAGLTIISNPGEPIILEDMPFHSDDFHT